METSDVENHQVEDKIIDDIYNIFKDVIGTNGINVSNIAVVVVSLMQIVEKYGKLKGPQKKQIVLSVLNRTVDNFVTDADESEKLKLLLSISIPSLIDTFISMDKGEIVINVKKYSRKLFSCCKNK